MTGADLTIGTTDGDTLDIVGKFGQDNVWTSRLVDLTPNITLLPGVMYAVVYRTSGSGSGNFAYAYAKRPGTYGGGKSYTSSNAGVTFTEQDLGPNHENPDVRFYTGNATDSYTPTPEAGPFEGTSAGVNGNTWKSQTISVTEEHELSAITMLFGKQDGGSPGTITVSIRELPPFKPINPTPSDSNFGVTLSQQTIEWESGGATDSYDVYYGLISGSLTKVASEQIDASFTIRGITDGSPFAYLDVRYWRIDAINTADITEGDEWAFTTIRLSPPKITYFYNGEYYQLLIQSDGTYGNHPADGGVEDTDYVVVTFEPNAIRTNKVLVACSNSKVWYEDIT